MTNATIPFAGRLRRRHLLALSCLAALATPLLCAPAHAETAFDWSSIATDLLPSVVNISNIHFDAAGPRQAMPVRHESLGSGFVINASGIIMTNRHVIADASQISVTMSDGTTYAATLLHQAALIDVALLKIEPTTPLHPVTFGDSDKLRVGEPVLAIGNPLGFGNSASAGIVSALDRDIQLSPFDAFIQTDAAINHGNSGGPLFNRAGHLIGMDTALFSPTDAGGSIGIGFSIPANDLQFIADKLMQFGWVRAGWIGATVQPVTAKIAAEHHFAQQGGVIVTGIAAGGPASRAGLKPGDLILKLGTYETHTVRSLNRAAGIQKVGSTVPIVLLRNGAMQTVEIAIDDSPEELKAAKITAP